VQNEEMGKWLRDLLRPAPDHGTRALARTVVIVTRSAPSERDEELAGDSQWPLENLTEPQVREYLRDVRDGRTPPGETVTLVYDVTGGHPATLRLVHELLWGNAPGTADPKELLTGLPAERGERAAILVERMVKRLGESELLAAVQAAAVPRRFDAPLLKALLQGDSGKFEAIRSLPFVDPVQSGGKKAYRVHKFVRQSILERMAALEPDHLEKLHELAALYFQDKLTKSFDAPSGQVLEYGDWYLVETPGWQELKREWLYHTAHLIDPKQEDNAVLEFALLFLDAFWWWGNYVHFRFCDEILADLARVAESVSGGRLQALHNALNGILQLYPVRSVKAADGNWEGVRAAVLQTRHACKLDNVPNKASTRQRDIAAMLQIFLAHTYRYQAPGHPDAEALYRTAVECYRGADKLLQGGRGCEEDSWNRAWVAYELADMLTFQFVNGGLSEADSQDQIQMLWQMARDEVQPPPGGSEPFGNESLDDELDDVEGIESPDHELMSGLHCVRAVLAAGEDARAAARCYGRAVAHAYLFNIVGSPPDDYTLQFYVDIRARALNHLLGLWKAGERETAETCGREMWAAFRRLQPSDYVQAQGEPSLSALLEQAAQGQPVPLGLALFPRGPRVSELGQEQSDFMGELLTLQNRLGSDVLHDLHEPA
jgi:hypothetical protein